MMGEYFPDVDRKTLDNTINQFGTQKILDYFHPERVPAPKSIEEGELQRKLRLEIQKALADVTLFYDPFDIEQFMLQKPPLDARQKRFKACVDRTWPKPVKEYKPLPPPPTQPPPVTASPIKEVAPPTPERAPGLAPPPGETGLGIDISYGIKPTGYTNTLELTITIYKGMF